MQATTRSDCLLCQANPAPSRTYAWHLQRGHKPDPDATLTVSLCDTCHDHNKQTKLVGWDFWDAVDGLETPAAQRAPSPDPTCMCGAPVAMVHPMGGYMCGECFREYNSNL